MGSRIPPSQVPGTSLVATRRIGARNVAVAASLDEVMEPGIPQVETVVLSCKGNVGSLKVSHFGCDLLEY